MRCILPCLFAALCISVGIASEQSARATINEAQERRAEALCQLQPESCGQRRYDPTIR